MSKKISAASQHGSLDLYLRQLSLWIKEDNESFSEASFGKASGEVLNKTNQAAFDPTFLRHICTWIFVYMGEISIHLHHSQV